MTKHVKRAYDSSGRQAKAAELQTRVVATALRLFVANGYGRTSLKSIAAEAGVSVETIYSAFGNKPELLRRAWYFAARGDAGEATLYDRPETQQILAEPDLATRLRAYATFIAAFHRRMWPLLDMLKGAAGAEPAAAAMLDEWAGRRLAVATGHASAAHKTGQLAVTQSECRDVIFAAISGDLWDQLVVNRHWSEARYAQWLGELWVHQLIG